MARVLLRLGTVLRRLASASVLQALAHVSSAGALEADGISSDGHCRATHRQARGLELPMEAPRAVPRPIGAWRFGAAGWRNDARSWPHRRKTNVGAPAASFWALAQGRRARDSIATDQNQLTAEAPFWALLAARMYAGERTLLPSPRAVQVKPTRIALTALRAAAVESRATDGAGRALSHICSPVRRKKLPAMHRV